MSVTITGLWANELRVRGGAPVSEAGQAIMYWGGGGHQAARLPGRRGHQAGKVARPSCAGGVGCQAGNVNRQARPVRSSCAGGEWVARQARSPGRQSRSGRHVLGGGGMVPGRQGRQAGKVTQQVRPVRPACAG